MDSDFRIAGDVVSDECAECKTKDEKIEELESKIEELEGQLKDASDGVHEIAEQAKALWRSLP